MDIKIICDMFDLGFELEGRKKKENDKAVLKSIEDMFISSVSTEIELPIRKMCWLAWMYGKTAKQIENIELNCEIMQLFLDTEKSCDEEAKRLSERYKYTSMYSVMMHRDDSI